MQVLCAQFKITGCIILCVSFIVKFAHRKFVTITFTNRKSQIKRHSDFDNECHSQTLFWWVRWVDGSLTLLMYSIAWSENLKLYLTPPVGFGLDNKDTTTWYSTSCSLQLIIVYNKSIEIVKKITSFIFIKSFYAVRVLDWRNL